MALFRLSCKFGIYTSNALTLNPPPGTLDPILMKIVGKYDRTTTLYRVEILGKPLFPSQISINRSIYMARTPKTPAAIPKPPPSTAPIVGAAFAVAGAVMVLREVLVKTV